MDGRSDGTDGGRVEQLGGRVLPWHSLACGPNRRLEGIMGKASLLSLLMAAAIAALMACEPAARPAATIAEPTQGGGGKPPSEPTPTPRPAEKSWTITAADFGDDEPTLTGAVSSRSGPYAWERITGGDVHVSIGGHELPFTSTSAKPVFASDISGAEWTVAAEVRAGAVALLLTAPDQTENAGFVESVTLTQRGSGYVAAPTVTFSAPPSGGATATGTAAGPGSVDSVRITNAGSGYTSAPTVTFSGGGGSSGAATAVLQSGVTSVAVTAEGAYSSRPTVTFGAPPSGGTGDRNRPHDR